jgi:hypothetical protein
MREARITRTISTTLLDSFCRSARSLLLKSEIFRSRARAAGPSSLLVSPGPSPHAPPWPRSCLSPCLPPHVPSPRPCLVFAFHLRPRHPRCCLNRPRFSVPTSVLAPSALLGAPRRHLGDAPRARCLAAPPRNSSTSFMPVFFYVLRFLSLPASTIVRSLWNRFLCGLVLCPLQVRLDRVLRLAPRL